MRWIISANIKIHGVGVGSLDDYGLTLFENGPTSHIAMVLSMHKVLICLTLLTHFSRQGCFYELSSLGSHKEMTVCREYFFVMKKGISQSRRRYNGQD